MVKNNKTLSIVTEKGLYLLIVYFIKTASRNLFP